MDNNKIRSELMVWLKTFVEKPNPALGNWSPCPYARKSRINNGIQIEFGDARYLESNVKDNLFYLDDPDEFDIIKDVLIICFDHNDISLEDLNDLVNGLNEDLMPKDYVILEDHPDATDDVVNGVRMNFGKCGLLLVQRLSKLNEASEQLKAKGYYDTWDQDALNYVVNWRN